MGNEIYEYCKKRPAFDEVTFLWEEPEILDIGGAIHNLASQSDVRYKGRVLILNGDQFFYLRKEELQKILSPFDKSPAVMFTYWVNSSLGYNALEIDSNRNVRGIIKNTNLPTDQRIETYTGISIIDLSQLDKISGVSKFFESVCPILRRDIPAILLENIDYWDFGTVKRYWETMFQILRTYRTRSTHPFIRFLVQEKALKTWKINLRSLSYHSSSTEVINLNQEIEIEAIGPAIYLNGSVEQKIGVPTIFWKDLWEEIK